MVRKQLPRGGEGTRFAQIEAVAVWSRMQQGIEVPPDNLMGRENSGDPVLAYGFTEGLIKGRISHEGKTDKLVHRTITLVCHDGTGADDFNTQGGGNPDERIGTVHIQRKNEQSGIGHE
jgi:hypothetical protein